MKTNTVIVKCRARVIGKFEMPEITKLTHIRQAQKFLKLNDKAFCFAVQSGIRQVLANKVRIKFFTQDKE